MDLFKKLASLFLRLNIAKKILLGYLALIVPIVLISAFTLSRLEKLNTISSDIIENDVPLMEITDKMIDNILAQELYARRYGILKSPDILKLFLEKSFEFDRLVEKIRAIPRQKDISVENIISLHSRYNGFLIKGIDYSKEPSSILPNKYDVNIKKAQEKLIGQIKSISIKAGQSQKEKTFMTSRIGSVAFKVTAVLFLIGVAASISATLLITRNIARPISQLKMATQKISEGKFEHIPHVKNQDELGDLAEAFNIMVQKLKRLEEMYLDANPLTRLPGNTAIESVLKKRLEAEVPLAFCLIDMDNFKAFNDRYGYARGSELIKSLGKIIEECVAETGTQDDFLGHIGGDDFVLITSPVSYSRICKAIINKFDKTIAAFYDKDDFDRGYIIGKTRLNQEDKFPVMTLSIAIVTNKERKLVSAVQVGELAAELKEYAKSISGSIYVVDRRRKSAPEDSDDNIIKFPRKASGHETHD